MSPEALQLYSDADVSFTMYPIAVKIYEHGNDKEPNYCIAS